MSLKESERIAMIVEYIRSGTVPDGYKIIEGKQGAYRVQKAHTKEEMLLKKKLRLEKQLEAINQELNSYQQAEEPVTVDEPETEEKADA